MIRGGFLSAEDRADLIELTRDGSAAHRLARRANAVLLLDDGRSCEEVAAVLFVDDATVRRWHGLFLEGGFDDLLCFDSGGSSSRLSLTQETELVSLVSENLPRSTRLIGVYIEKQFDIVYDSRSGLVALLHRLGLLYSKPETIGRKLCVEEQQEFVKTYEKLFGSDETVLFVDAVHPTHAARSVGCWGPSGQALAIEQTSGRQRLNVHGAVNLETGDTRMIDVEVVNATSTIRLLQSIEAMYPLAALIHVFLDNARYHHAALVQQWLLEPGRRIQLHFIPKYCPHLNSIERLWGIMHGSVQILSHIFSSDSGFGLVFLGLKQRPHVHVALR